MGKYKLNLSKQRRPRFLALLPKGGKGGDNTLTIHHSNMDSNNRPGQVAKRITLGTPIPSSPARHDPGQTPMSVEKGHARPGAKSKTTTRKTSKTKHASDKVGNRQWSDYEMQTLLALICKGFHLKKGGALSFATALNEALNGKRREHMDDDVDVEDVALLLEWLEKEKKGAL
jgi:hypothetical protein